MDTYTVQLTKEKKVEVSKPALAIAGGILAVSAGLFFLVPIKGEMRVQRTRWEWDIPLYQYTVHEEHRWDYAPEGAYDIKPKRERRGTKKVGDQEVPNYDWKFYYKINRWDDHGVVGSMGFDKEPYEHECAYPFEYDAPAIGDIKRGGHTETYYSIGIIGDDTVEYKVDKDIWLKLEPEDKITFKKFRFGEKIWDVEFK